MALVSSAFDNRERHSIARSKTHTITVPAGSTSASKSFTLHGQLIAVIYNAPDLATDTSFTLQLSDMDDLIIYSQSYSDNTKGIDWVVDTTTRVCYGMTKVTVSFTTVQASDVDFEVAFVLK